MTQLTRPQTLDDYLTHAEKVVSEKKSRLTPIRRHIYKCLLMELGRQNLQPFTVP